MRNVWIGVCAAGVIAMLAAVAPRAQSVQELSKVSPPGTVTDMGGTYYALEAKAKKVTIRFGDGSHAVSQRHVDGRITSRLSDASGVEKLTLAVDHGNALRLRRDGADALQATAPPGVRRTLDWAALQAHALSQSTGSLRWQGDFLRAPQARMDFEAVEAEFDTGVVAKAVRGKGQFETVLTRDGVEVGRVKWLPREQVLAWRFAGLTEGYVNPGRLKNTNGFWFTPSLQWSTIQALAFYEFHSLMKAQGSVARNDCAPPRNLARRAVDAMFPTVYANDPGCDNLHWLDNSIFRPCCDSHDRCFAKIGCSAWSWFAILDRYWACTPCNIAAVVCFATGGGYQGPFYQSP